jgi:hypothetical protein
LFIDDEQVQSYIASGKAAATTFSEVWIVFDNRRRSAHTKATMTGMLGSPKAGAGVAVDTLNVHTPIMTLKNVALLALIGTILMTALLAWTFVFDVLGHKNIASTGAYLCVDDDTASKAIATAAVAFL